MYYLFKCYIINKDWVIIPPSHSGGSENILHYLQVNIPLALEDCAPALQKSKVDNPPSSFFKRRSIAENLQKQLSHDEHLPSFTNSLYLEEVSDNIFFLTFAV